MNKLFPLHNSLKAVTFFMYSKYVISMSTSLFVQIILLIGPENEEPFFVNNYDNEFSI